MTDDERKVLQEARGPLDYLYGFLLDLARHDPLWASKVNMLGGSIAGLDGLIDGPGRLGGYPYEIGGVAEATTDWDSDGALREVAVIDEETA